MTSHARPTTLYNPHLLTQDELRGGFVARQPLLDALVDDLRRGGGQHHLLIGARGTGKTTLLLRLGVAIDDDPALARRAIALRFPEEQYNIIRPSDFWLNCLDALVDALERRGLVDEAAHFDALIIELEAVVNEDARARQALAALTGWAARASQLVVLLVDNLDIVLDRLTETHWALRKVLSAESRLVMVGASSSQVPETFEYGAAFYDFFNVHELGGLDDDEARRVLLRLSEVLDTPQVARAIEANPGRLKSLLLLSGGTPRTLQLLHGVLAQGSTSSAERDIELMLDQVTPYYKARFEDLPPQAQQIFDAVALHWHPMTAIECADKTRLEVTLVSAQLTRLARQGVIAKVPHPSGKLGFQIAERFFGIWYMMRASRRLRRKLFWLAVCLQKLYGDDEFARQAASLLAASSAAAAAVAPEKLLAFAEASTDAAVKRRLERRAVTAMLQAGDRSARWDGLDLEGADRDLKGHVDRATMLDTIRASVEQHVKPPPGRTPRECADAIAGNPLVALRMKAVIARGMTRSTVQLPVGPLIAVTAPWPVALTAAVRAGEVMAFPDAASAEDVDDIVALLPPGEAREHALGLLAGCTPDVVSQYAVSLQEAPTPHWMCLAAFQPGDEWPVIRTRLARALRLLQRETSAAWEDASIWFLAAQRGFATECADLLAELGLHERALPLYEALRAYADGASGELIHLAPEVRVPTEHYLSAFRARAAEEAVAGGQVAIDASPPLPPRPRRATRKPPTTAGTTSSETPAKRSPRRHPR
ncbi:MAG: ATP-binding protein [Kofleriaceae bacterium]